MRVIPDSSQNNRGSVPSDAKSGGSIYIEALDDLVEENDTERVLIKPTSNYSGGGYTT